MEFDEVLRRRRMRRSFRNEPIPNSVIRLLIKAAFRGPSAGFTQGYEYLAISDTSARARLLECITTPGWLEAHPTHSGIANAPLLLVPLVDQGAYLARYMKPDKSYTKMASSEAWPIPFWYVDTGFSTLLVLLKAVDLDLAACFIGIYRGHDELRSTFGVPARLEPLGLIAIGLASEEEPVNGSALRQPKRADESRVHWNAYQSDPASTAIAEQNDRI
ncbi:MAG: nitroreductase family protein [Ferrimicrobium sp.]